MSRLVIKGPAELNGEISVRGAKNAALVITDSGGKEQIKTLGTLY